LKVICLTGGLASGKSTAASYLGTLGAHVIDADKLGHLAYDPGTQAYRQVIDTFGEDIVADDSHIDRKVLGGKVFGKPEELKKLTDIVWPEIRRLAETEINGLDAAYPDDIVILEAAVLFEAGWEDIGEECWVVIVDREVAIKRSMERDGLEQEAVENRLNSQLTNDERVAKADIVFKNNDSLEALMDSLTSEWERISN